MKQGIVAAGVFFFIFCLLFTPIAQAGFYKGVVKVVNTKPPNGDTIVQVDPGATETGFSDTARIRLEASDPGSNKGLAAVLTAVSMDKEISFEVPDVPSWNPIQTATSIGLALY